MPPPSQSQATAAPQNQTTQKKKKRDKEKDKEKGILVHPVLCFAPGANDLKMKAPPFLYRYPNVFYPKNDAYKYYRETWGENPVIKEMIKLLFVSDFRKPNKIYVFGHVLNNPNKLDVNARVADSRKKTQKLEIESSYSIPDVGNFRITRKIGVNSYAAHSKDERFGTCFLTLEAIGRNKKHSPTQFLDVRFYMSIKETATTHRKHFLQLHCFGLVDRQYHWAVFELGGPSLIDLFCMCKREWSKSTLIQVAVQTLQGIHDTHLHHNMHRLIDPNSFIVGTGDKHRIIYIIDFSHCYEYTERTRKQRRGEKPPTDETPRRRYKTPMRRDVFAPRVYHLGANYRRMDDVESWFLMFYWFLQKGNLAITGEEERLMYLEKCNIMYGAYLASSHVEIKSYLEAIIRAIDQYDESINSTVDFPYFAAILENIAVTWNITGKEPMDWAPSPKDPNIMVVRTASAPDTINDIAAAKKLATATLILPDE